VLQLLFARPVRRWEYVMSRWLAVCASAGSLVLLQVALVVLAGARHGLPEGREVFVVVADQVAQAIGTASVILLFSSLLSGVGDVLAIVLTFVSAQVVGGIGQWRENPVLVRTAAEIMRFVGPQLPIPILVSGARVPWFDVVSYLSTVALCVAVAVAVVNRREISYASD
jgi:ABC-type transport system involved in multi-copper enzyme maturation permease subunit